MQLLTLVTLAYLAAAANGQIAALVLGDWVRPFVLLDQRNLQIS